MLFCSTTPTASDVLPAPPMPRAATTVGGLAGAPPSVAPGKFALELLGEELFARLLPFHEVLAERR